MSVLLLNATHEPLRVISLKRAVVLVLQEKAEIIEEEPGRLMRSATVSLAAPRVIRLTRFVQIPYTAKIPLSNRAVLAHHGHECAYCGKHAATIDHVIPRSRGGRHEWKNVVAACRPCNARKDNKLLSELGWKLRYTPQQPHGTFWMLFGIREQDPSWEPYLAMA